LRSKSLFIILVLSLGILFLQIERQAYADTRLLINKGTNQLALFQDGYLLDVFPVATGRLPQYTPEGKCQVVVKQVYPSWRHPDGGPVIPGGVPENPLGPRWLGLNARGTSGSSYGIHGNNNPYSIGTHASSGCIRMYNEDILWLYERIPVGTEIEIINSREDLSAGRNYDRVTVNGETPDFAPHLGPVQSGNSTFLPLRPTAELLGYRLRWDDSTKTVSVINIDRELYFSLDSSEVTVNNHVYLVEDTPFLFEGTTFVPDYYFERFFGVSTNHVNESRTLALEASPETGGDSLLRHNLSIRINGKTIYFPENIAPLSDGENLLVPVRQVCSALGVSVDWDYDAKSVDIEFKEKLATIPADGSAAKVNGAVFKTPPNLFTRNGCSYVSLRFLEDFLGFKTELDDKSRVLKITTSEKNKQMVSLLFPSVEAQNSYKRPFF